MLEGYRNRKTAYALSIFLGIIGAQFFYLNRVVYGVMCVLFCWTLIPALVGVGYFFYLLQFNEEEFDDEFNGFWPSYNLRKLKIDRKQTPTGYTDVEYLD